MLSYLNNSEIKFNNTNSIDAMVQDFNFQQEIKRGFMVHEGSFQISIPMLNNLNIPGININPQQTVGKLPYLTQMQHNLLAGGKPSDPGLTKLPNTGKVGNHIKVPPAVGKIKYNVGTALTTGWKNTTSITSQLLYPSYSTKSNGWCNRLAIPNVGPHSVCR